MSQRVPNSPGPFLAKRAGVRGQSFIVFFLILAFAAHAANPFDWIGPILAQEGPLSVEDQRKLSAALAGNALPKEWRQGVAKAFIDSPVRDAETALQLIQALDQPANQPFRSFLHHKVIETGFSEFLGFTPSEREPLEKGFLELANNSRNSLLARQQALKVLGIIGVSRETKQAMGPLSDFTSVELQPIFLSRPERNTFAELWMVENPDIEELRSHLLSTGRELSLNDYHAGLVSLLVHSSSEVRDLAAQVLERSLHADRAFHSVLLPSESDRLHAYHLRNGAAPFLAWRFARSNERRLAILDRAEGNQDPNTLSALRRASRWDRMNLHELVRERLTALIGSCPDLLEQIAKK